MHKSFRVTRALKNLSVRSSSHQSTIDVQCTTDWDNALPYTQIPGPKPYPIVGNIWRFLPKIGTFSDMDQLAQHDYLNKTYGDIVRISGLILRKDIVVLFSPNDFEQLFRNEGIWPRRESLFSYIYYKQKIRPDVFQGQVGVLAGQGKQWHDVRTVVNPVMMQPRNIRTYIGAMSEVSDSMVERVRSLSSNPERQLPEDFLDEIHKWALESICIVALNKKLGLLDPNIKNPEALQFIRDVLEMFNMLNELEVKPSGWKWISTPTWRRFVKTLNRMTEFQLTHLNEAINSLEKNKSDDKQLSVIEKLLLIDNKIALSMAYDMLVAGIDTTSRIVSASLYYLSINPEKQERLRDELKRVLPRPDTPITHERLESMPYLRAVIKETTRFAPIAIGNLRQAPKDMVLSGYQIPEGTDLLTSNMLLCRREEYFSNPDSFIPERWLRDNKYEYTNSNPFVFQPFGFGPRSCIGKRLANLEIECFLAKMFRNFRFDWPHPEMKWIMTMLYGVGSPLKFQVTPLES